MIIKAEQGITDREVLKDILKILGLRKPTEVILKTELITVLPTAIIAAKIPSLEIYLVLFEVWVRPVTKQYQNKGAAIRPIALITQYTGSEAGTRKWAKWSTIINSRARTFKWNVFIFIGASV